MDRSLPIDLTGDSNSEDEGPLSNMFAPSKAQPPASLKTPVPLPENVRHLYPTLATSKSKSNQSPITPLGSMQRQGAHGFSASQAGKRRKLSVPSRSTSGTSINGAHKMPLVQSLNTALKSTGSLMHLSEDLTTAQPRALEFRRSSQDDYAAKLTVDQDEAVDVPNDAFQISPLKEAPISIQQQPVGATLALSTPDFSAEAKTTATRTGQNNDLISVILDSSGDMNVAAPTLAAEPAISSVSNVQQALQAATPWIPPTGRVTYDGPLRDEEGDLLIFLKEVKKLSWKEITAEFNQSYAGRAYTKLQSHYSMKLNKRDRSKDPPRLRLPARYGGAVAIDWSAVHAENPGTANLSTTEREATISQEPLDQISRRDRPRRTVPVKDYTWPRRLRQVLLEEAEESDFNLVGLADTDTPMELDSEEPLELVKSAPEKAIPVDNDPVVMNFEKEDARLAVSAQRKQAIFGQILPYLSSAQRSSIQDTTLDQEWDQLCSRDWQGSLVHVDFSAEELDIVDQAVHKVLNIIPQPVKRKGRRRRLQKSLQKLTEPRLLHIATEARRRLYSRDNVSIKAFLQDARAGQIHIIRPRIERLAAARPNKYHTTDVCQKMSASSMIRHRETGHFSRRGWSAAPRPLSYQIKNKVHDTLGPAFTYTGASSDVHAVAWSPDGQCFAGGAISVDDPHSMQYNRPNNLIYGDVTYGVMHELGRHRVDRPRTESGPNSTHAMFASQDPKLYKTVSSVAFSPNGRFLFSGGYDHSVCVWETTSDGSQPEWRVTWRHKAPVDMMAVNSSGLLATASKKPSTNAVKTIRIFDDPEVMTKESFSSQKATTRPDRNILPTALQFSPRFENLLLAGFGANVRSDGRDLSGDICLWDVNNPQKPLSIHGTAYNVFDLSFHGRNNWFAVGCVAGQNVNRGTQSVLRLYDGSGFDDKKYSSRMELECKALDMNDVVWCPGDDYLIAAGCTSGRAYVWDVRRPNVYLRELAHANSLLPLDDTIDPEVTDTGIRFLSWGDNAARLYTGSSDGVVKVWNVVCSDDETFVKDLITTDSGIMSGALSADKSRLILGEVNGSVSILEVGREDCVAKDAEKFKFVPYIEEEEEEDESQQASLQGSESGIASARELLATGQIQQFPMSGGLPIYQAVQGPNYDGPFDSSVDAPFLREQALEFQLNLSRSGAGQCRILGCNDVIKITAEETGDSGRSADRIPDELRQQWETTSRDYNAGKSQCKACGRSARPASSSRLDNIVLCERCSFACFRCGAVSDLPPTAEMLVCTACGCAWEIGALGYECVREPSKRYAKELMEERVWVDEQLGEEASFGDDMNALTDYYFGLAINQSDSPPL